MRLEEVFDVEMPAEFLEARHDWTRLDVLFYNFLYQIQRQREADARYHRRPPEAEDAWGLTFTEAEKAALWATFQWVVADELGAPLEDVHPQADLIRDLDAG